MTRLSRILKDHHESGAMNALINIHAAIDEQIFLTKGGDLVMMLAARGVDYECLDPSQLDQIARRFEAAVRVFDENFRLYQYLVKRDGAALPHRTYDNPVVQAAIKNRIAYLQRKANSLYSVETYYAVVYQGWKQANAHKLAEFLTRPLISLREMLSSKVGATVLEHELDGASDILTNKVMSFLVQLQDTIHVEVLDKQRAFRFLRQLVKHLAGGHVPRVRPIVHKSTESTCSDQNHRG